MQRDVYAALIKKRHKEFIPLRILQLSGEVTNEKIFDEVFEGHRLRRLILMTHMAGTDAGAGPVLPADICVETFNQLKALHRPHYMYKLLPMLCGDASTFQLLQSICSSPGSPFGIHHRVETTAFTVSFTQISRWRSELAELLELYSPDVSTDTKKAPTSLRERELPLPSNSIFMDGLLMNEHSTAMVHVLPQIPSELSLYEYGVMAHMLKHSLWLRKAFYSASVPLFSQFFASKHWFHMIGVQKPLLTVDPAVREPLLKMAAKCSITLYEKREDGGGQYQYVPNPFPFSATLPHRKQL